MIRWPQSIIFSHFWAKITLEQPFGKKNIFENFLRFCGFLHMIFGRFWREKRKFLFGPKSTPKRVCNHFGVPRRTLEAFQSVLKIFWNFELFVIKCLKNGYFHASQKSQNFGKVKNDDFERVITFCRKAYFRWSDRRFVALWKLYKTAVSARKMSSHARSNGPLKIVIFRF